MVGVTLSSMRPSNPQWIGIALLVLVLPALTATAWPLVAELADRAPKGIPVWRLALAVGLGAALATALFLVRGYIPRLDLDQIPLVRLITASWAIALGTVAAMALLVWFVLGLPGLQSPTSLAPRDMDAIATRAFAIVAGLGGVALLVISFRRQRATEHAEHRAERAADREVSKLFTDTFDSASEKLGSEHPAVRLAGVHALARLVDEAPEGREDLAQMVIDVLCAYLRMPYSPAPDSLPENASDVQKNEHHEKKIEFTSRREVRHTIIRIIGSRLRNSSRWQGKDYDFTGAVFDGGDFSRAKITGGTMRFTGATFCTGMVSFAAIEVTNGVVDFGFSRISGSGLMFTQASFNGGVVDFVGIKLMRGGVSFSRAEFSGSKVDFRQTKFAGGYLAFVRSKFSGGLVDFSQVNFAKGDALFRDVEFSDGRVDFTDAKFSDGVVNISVATGGYPSTLRPPPHIRMSWDWIDFDDVDGGRDSDSE